MGVIPEHLLVLPPNNAHMRTKKKNIVAAPHTAGARAADVRKPLYPTAVFGWRGCGVLNVR